jgi:bifunctional lysine-specific demethylase and histidyl-hydroxylase NO66
VRLVRDGQTLSPQTYTKSARLQSRMVDDFVDPGKVMAAFADNVTIVLQALHRYWEPLGRFCRDLELTLTHPVQTNVYLTPPASRGLDVHYDTHDVFVLQVSGVKHWEVYGQAIDSPLAHQRRRGKYPDPGRALVDVELKPGDSLYIPRGFLHGAEAQAQESTHMTIGVLSLTWMDMVKAALRKAADEVFVRDALPAGWAHTPGTFNEPARAKLRQLARWLEELDPDDLTARMAERFWSGRAPSLAGQLTEILAADSVEDDSVLRRRRGAVCRTKLDGDDLILLLGDRRLRLPVRVRTAVDHMLSREQTKVRDLEAHLDAAGRLVLARRLIKEGLFEQAPGE